MPTNQDHTGRTGPASLEWCEDRAETIAHDVDDEEYAVIHLCRHAQDHDGPHQCWLCTASWDSEPPC